MMTDMEDFFVVHTKPNQENKAKKTWSFKVLKLGYLYIKKQL